MVATGFTNVKFYMSRKDLARKDARTEKLTKRYPSKLEWVGAPKNGIK